MVAQGGQQAAEAVGVANAEVMAAKQAANERRALWMKYLRSRGIVPASQQQRNAGTVPSATAVIVRFRSVASLLARRNDVCASSQ